MSKRDSRLKVKYELEGRRPTMSGSATPVIAQIVEAMRVKIINSDLEQHRVGLLIRGCATHRCKGVLVWRTNLRQSS
jgi:hypothetical protein